MAREKSVGQLVSWSVGGALLPFLGFFGSLFCPKSFFFKSVVSFSLVVCVFFASFDVFVSRCTSRRKETWVHQRF